MAKNNVLCLSDSSPHHPHRQPADKWADRGRIRPTGLLCEPARFP